MIAEAPAVQLSVIGHGHPSSGAPGGIRFADDGSVSTSTSTLQACGDRINAAIATGSDYDLRRANKWARHEIDSLRHASAAGAETAGEFGDRIVSEHEGELAGVVARAEMTSVTTVRKMREQRGREPKSGHKLAGEGLGGVTG